jgi:hypothetical protein
MEDAARPALTFERVLGAMRKIAEAVNQFDDPEIKRAAFDLLTSALGVETRPAPTTPR